MLSVYRIGEASKVSLSILALLSIERIPSMRQQNHNNIVLVSVIATGSIN